MYLLCGFSKTFMVIIKKNSACLNDLANSTQPANTGKKTTSSMQKRKVYKHQVRECRSVFSKNLKRQPNHQIRK